MRTKSLLAVSLSAALLLSACGGGGGSTNITTPTPTPVPTPTPTPVPTPTPTPTPETINGIVVPPEPDATVNNASIQGVDINTNGVRDDVERKIAQEFGGNEAKYTTVFNIISSEQKMITNPSEETVGNYKKLISCALKAKTIKAAELDVITRKNLNTPSRGVAYADTLSGIEVLPSDEECQ
ncbi:MAG: hypothetical protein WAQ53_18540 [Thiofilum sp.]|uniref:hypothetical protein n=1 Tax=Thiofilum sp. TaxID=2212733 RepID=UPI003BB0BC97